MGEHWQAIAFDISWPRSLAEKSLAPKCRNPFRGSFEVAMGEQ